MYHANIQDLSIDWDPELRDRFWIIINNWDQSDIYNIFAQYACIENNLLKIVIGYWSMRID